MAMPLTSLICKVHLEINQEEEREDDFYALSEKDTCIVTEFLQSVEMQQRASMRASATPRQRNDFCSKRSAKVGGGATLETPFSANVPSGHHPGKQRCC